MPTHRILRKSGRRRVASSLTAIVSASLLGLAGIAPATAAPTPSPNPFTGPLPVPFSIQAGVLASLDPITPPPGANEWDCTPSPERPRPVILIHPTGTTQSLAWQSGAPLFNNAGYCVFTFNYGNATPIP